MLRYGAGGRWATCPALKPTGAGAQAAHQQEHADDRQRQGEDDQSDGDKLLMVRLASRGAVRDQQEQPEEGGGRNPEEDEHDAEENSDDRFQRAATG